MKKQYRAMEVSDSDVVRYYVASAIEAYQEGNPERTFQKLRAAESALRSNIWERASHEVLWHPSHLWAFLTYLSALDSASNRNQAIRETFEKVVYEIAASDIRSYNNDLQDEINRIDSVSTEVSRFSVFKDAFKPQFSRRQWQILGYAFLSLIVGVMFVSGYEGLSIVTALLIPILNGLANQFTS
jgi:hypothetical protein